MLTTHPTKSIPQTGNTSTVQTNTLETLISEYLNHVHEATELLERYFGTKNILRLWRSGKIPQRGSVTEDVTYELHGIGCCVYLSNLYIDFDYGPDDRVDGFDIWRLYNYACELPHKYKQYTDEGYLNHEFLEYLKLEKAKKIPGSTSNLYFIQQ